ncbi:MAG: DNA translocase FtsK, partial [Terriglobia bacterium]
GRIVADTLIHFFNIVGAYIVCIAIIAVALYLTTAFSFGALSLWSHTRLGFMYAALDRFADWRADRRRRKTAKELEKKRAAAGKPVVTAQLVPKRADGATELESTAAAAVPVPVPSTGHRRSGIDRTFDIDDEPLPVEASVPAGPAEDIAVTSRADATQHGKTTMPRLAGSFKLPSTALLHRPDEHSAVNDAELKNLAQLLAEKCGEFDVRGQVVQINPGPVVTTFEFKPEAGIKYSRVTGLCDDLCLALRAESILIERMAGKSTVGIQVPNHERETIWLREVVEAQEFLGSKSKLTLALGKDINGRIKVAALESMPHLLIAGSTGSGKSVMLNSLIMSILYKATPQQV